MLFRVTANQLNLKYFKLGRLFMTCQIQYENDTPHFVPLHGPFAVPLGPAAASAGR